MDTEPLILSRGYKKVCMYKWQMEFLFQNSKSTKLKKKNNLNTKLKVQVCKSAKSQIWKVDIWELMEEREREGMEIKLSRKY